MFRILIIISILFSGLISHAQEVTTEFTEVTYKLKAEIVRNSDGSASLLFPRMLMIKGAETTNHYLTIDSLQQVCEMAGFNKAETYSEGSLRNGSEAVVDIKKSNRGPNKGYRFLYKSPDSILVTAVCR
jgi:hypothetical protein